MAEFSFSELAIGFLLNAAMGLVAAGVTLPAMRSRTTRLVSQVAASACLLWVWVLFRALTANKAPDARESLGILLLIAPALFTSMVLIANYARSVGRTPFWSFVAILSFPLSVGIMATTLWRGAASPSSDLPAGR